MLRGSRRCVTRCSWTPRAPAASCAGARGTTPCRRCTRPSPRGAPTWTLRAPCVTSHHDERVSPECRPPSGLTLVRGRRALRAGSRRSPDRGRTGRAGPSSRPPGRRTGTGRPRGRWSRGLPRRPTVSYTHLRAHENVIDIVCRLMLEKKKQHQQTPQRV